MWNKYLVSLGAVALAAAGAVGLVNIGMPVYHGNVDGVYFEVRPNRIISPEECKGNNGMRIEVFYPGERITFIDYDSDFRIDPEDEVDGERVGEVRGDLQHIIAEIGRRIPAERVPGTIRDGLADYCYDR